MEGKWKNLQICVNADPVTPVAYMKSREQSGKNTMVRSFLLTKCPVSFCLYLRYLLLIYVEWVFHFFGDFFQV